jgi:hypothetical protein
VIEIKPADGTAVWVKPEDIRALIVASRFAEKQQLSTIVCAIGAGTPMTVTVTDIEADRVLGILRSIKPETFIDAKLAGLAS